MLRRLFFHWQKTGNGIIQKFKGNRSNSQIYQAGDSNDRHKGDVCKCLYH